MIAKRWIALLLFLLTGCQLASLPTATPASFYSASPSLQPSITPLQSPAVSPAPITETPQATPAPHESGELSAEGPWLVFHSPEGIWAANQDGSGLKLVLDRSGRGSPDPVYRTSPSPAGGVVALIEIDDRSSASVPWLRLLRLPDGELTTIAQLHPEVSEPNPHDLILDRWAAAGVSNEIAWSPDGGKLAFNAVIDGESGDLYVYDLQLETLTRLSDGPTETVFPIWSPDGQRIIHGAVDRLYADKSGAGYDYSGAWSVRVDGSGSQLLYSTQVNGFEQVLGWLSDSEMLVVTNAPNTLLPCSYRDLRTIDVDSLETRHLAVGPFNQVAFNPLSQTVVMSVPQDEVCQTERTTGVYWLDLNSEGTPLKVVEDPVFELGWSESSVLFFAATPFGALAVGSSGQFIDLVVPEGTNRLPQQAPGSGRLAWSGDSLWVGTLQDNLDMPPILVKDGRIDSARWSPDGQYLHFMSEQGYFVASEPDFVPREIIGLSGESPVWVLAPDD
jgi:dipeptidyl aminopeptidase/acylaminoacyl peptidase